MDLGPYNDMSEPFYQDLGHQYSFVTKEKVKVGVSHSPVAVEGLDIKGPLHL